MALSSRPTSARPPAAFWTQPEALFHSAPDFPLLPIQNPRPHSLAMGSTLSRRRCGRTARSSPERHAYSPRAGECPLDHAGRLGTLAAGRNAGAAMRKKLLAVSPRTIEFETMLLGAEILRFGARKSKGRLGSLGEALLLAASLVLGQTQRDGERLMEALFQAPNLRHPSRTIRRIVGTWLAGESPREEVSRVAISRMLRTGTAQLAGRNEDNESNTPGRKPLRQHRRPSAAPLRAAKGSTPKRRNTRKGRAAS